jgi:hypothetical protein
MARHIVYKRMSRPDSHKIGGEICHLNCSFGYSLGMNSILSDYAWGQKTSWESAGGCMKSLGNVVGQTARQDRLQPHLRSHSPLGQEEHNPLSELFPVKLRNDLNPKNLQIWRRPLSSKLPSSLDDILESRLTRQQDNPHLGINL